MKRGLFFILGLFAILIFLSLVSALDNSAANVGPASFQTATNNALNGQVAIPGNLQVIARFLFGINDSISLSVFIVLIVIWIFLLLIIQGALEFLPYTRSKIMSWLVAIIITLLVAISGAIRDLALYIIQIGNDITFLKDYGIFTLLLVVLVIGAFVIIIKHAMSKVKKGVENVKAEDAAFRAGIGRRLGRK